MIDLSDDQFNKRVFSKAFNLNSMPFMYTTSRFE